MPAYCEICRKPVLSWEAHRDTEEHKLKLVEVKGIPSEVKELGERMEEYWKYKLSGAEEPGRD